MLLGSVACLRESAHCVVLSSREFTSTHVFDVSVCVCVCVLCSAGVVKNS